MSDAIDEPERRTAGVPAPGVLTRRRVELAALSPEELAAAVSRITQTFAPVRALLEQMVTALGAWLVEVNDRLQPLLAQLQDAESDGDPGERGDADASASEQRDDRSTGAAAAGSGP